MTEHFSDADVAHYADSYRDPDHLSAAFESYRAFPDDAKFFAAQRNAYVRRDLVQGSAP